MKHALRAVAAACLMASSCNQIADAPDLTPTEPLGKAESALDGWTTDDVVTAAHDFHYFGVAVTSVGRVWAVGDRDSATPFQSTGVIRNALEGAGWTGVEFSLPFQKSSTAFAVTVDSSDNIYVAGVVRDSDSFNYWIVWESTNGGTSWNTIDDFRSNTVYPEPIAIGIDSSGAILVAGNVTESSTGVVDWAVRRRATPTSPWVWADVFAGSGQFGMAQGVCFFGSDVFVSGYTLQTGTQSTWLVRKSSNHGANWTTVDSVAGTFYSANGCAGSDGAGFLYVSGAYTDANQKAHWLTRSSVDGTTFANSDDVIGAQGTVAFAPRFGRGGTAYVVGDLGTTALNWHVRKSNNGTDWFDSDDFAFTGGVPPAGGPHMFAFSPASGTRFTVGWMADTTGLDHGIVRKF